MASTTKAQWGVKGSVSGVTGVVTELSVSEETIVGTQQNEIGAVIQQAMYDTKTTMSATVECPASAKIPTSGSSITIGGYQGYVLSASKQESNTAYQKISISAEFYKNCKQTTPVS